MREWLPYGVTWAGIRTQALMLVLAALTGFGVATAGVPAGWLSGAMFSTAALSALRIAVPLSDSVRRVALTCSGFAIGSAVTPAMLKSLAAYPASLALMAMSVVAVTYICARMLLRLPGWSASTAMLASVPGALSYVFAVAAQTEKADMPRIAVIQVMRIFFLMGLVPLVVREIGSPTIVILSGPIDPPAIILIVFALGALAGLALEKLRVAGGMMFGAMLVSAVAHGSGWAPGRLPLVVSEVAQVLVGTWVGARFVGFDWHLLWRSLKASLSSFIAAILIAGMFSAFTAFVLGFDFETVLIAFAPGGLEGDDVTRLRARPRSAVRWRASPGALSVHQRHAAICVALVACAHERQEHSRY